MTENQYPDLIELGRQSLERFRAEFAAYGIEADPEMKLHKGAGMLCYYDFNDRQIYLSMPDFNAPTGKLQMLMFRQMLHAPDNDSLMRFLAIFIPFVVAHEMTHHFRHKYGLFGEDSWHEEQLANRMAAAVNKHRISPEEREFALNFLGTTMKRLGEQIGISTDAADSYYDIAHALHTSDHISDEEMINLGMAQSMAPISSSATMMLRRSGNLSDGVKDRLEKRRALIFNFNEQYASDAARYIYYQVGWVYLAMQNRDSSYVDEFARKHLNMAPFTLDINPPQEYKSRAIYACYKASALTKQSRPTVSRYFYKRYRAFLVDYLMKNHQAVLQEVGDLDDVNFEFLSSWNDRVNDPLNFIIGMTPPIVREIFPNRIGMSSVIRDICLPDDLPAPEDKQIWDYKDDSEPGLVRNTIQFLERFDQLELFRSLPPETMLALAQKFYTVHLEAGETLVWQGETNNDVFVLVNGKLNAIVQDSETNSIRPGEVFGEIAWLTKSSRIASVRAAEASTCLVIKENDLRLLCYKSPDILMAIAGVTARRYRDSRS